MGRSRGGYKHCVMRSLDDDQGTWANDERYRKGVSWCGESRLFGEKERSESPRMASCPKCSAAIGKARLKQLPRLELRKMDKPIGPYMRSSYEVLIDGDLKGWVTIDNGWGTYWNLYQLREPDAYSSYEHGRRISGNRVNHFDAERWPTEGEHADKYTFWPVHWASKEAMAAAAWTAWQRGLLPTVEEMQARIDARKAKAEADKIEAAQRQAERERLAIEARRVKDERLEAWRLAYVDLTAREGLTNLERAGLEAAQALITGS